MAITSGWRKYLSANSAQADFTALTADVANGQRADQSVQGGELFINYAAALTAAGGPNLRVVRLQDFNGAKIQIFGECSDGHQCNYRIWTVSFCYASTAHLTAPLLSDIVAVNIASHSIGVATAGTATGVSGGLVSATELFADTITYAPSTTATTPSGPATEYETDYAFGGSGAYSPADNSIAQIIVPDFGNVDGFLIEFDKITGTGWNCIYQLTL